MCAIRSEDIAYELVRILWMLDIDDRYWVSQSGYYVGHIPTSVIVEFANKYKIK